MASYSQWHSAADVPKRVTWLCGSETVLVEEIVDWVREKVSPGDRDYVSLVAGDCKEPEIWAALNQYPTDVESKRLVLVRHAERIKRWTPLDSWFSEARRMPNSHIVFVSAEQNFDVDRPSHRMIVDKGGSMIRCGPLDEDRAVDWIRRKCEMHPDVALHLFSRSGADLAISGQTAVKLSLFPGEPGNAVVDALLPPSPAAEFTDCLVAGDRRSAVLALDRLPEQEYSKAVGLLDSRLETLSKMYVCVRRGMTPRDMAQQRVVPPFLARLLYPYAKIYDDPTVLRRRQALLLVDGYVRDGVKEGVMESLCALW